MTMKSWTWALLSAAMACGAPVLTPPPDAGAGGGAVVAAGGGAGGGSAGGEAAGGGGVAGGGDAGGSAGGGSVGGGSSAGGGTAGGGAAGGGVYMGPGCLAPTRCEDGTGAGDFICLDPGQPNRIPAGAPSCGQSGSCPAGYGCFTAGSASVCLKECEGTTGTGGGGTGGGSASGVPRFVGAGGEVATADGGTLSLTGPATVEADDLYLAIIDADEAAGQLTVTAPAGWTLLGGWPIHNLNTGHSPYIIPASYNHGFWVYRAWSTGTQPLQGDFSFNRPAAARGVVVAYRGVDLINPINDKVGFARYGDGRTNGFGSGNTTLQRGLEVGIIATSPTPWPHSISFAPAFGEVTRVYSGEQPNGLELLVVDQPLSLGVYTGLSVLFKRAPSNLTTSVMYGLATLVLTPR